MTLNAGSVEFIIKADTEQLLVANKQVDRSLSDLDVSFDKAAKSVNKTEKAMFALSKTAALVTSAISVGAVVSMVDEWGQVAARIKMALKSVEGDITKYGAIQERFLEISNRNGKAIEDTQLLYVGAATSMQELGYNTDQTVDYIESLSSSLTANASSANETQSMINALNKSMVAGKVAGENWNSIMNATPTIIGDIAKELSVMRGGVKVTETEVKKMASEGKISFQLFADAVIKAKEANNAMADSMDNTVADGFTKLTNSAKAYYGELNQSLGITRSVSAGFAVLTENFDYLASAIATVVAIGAAKYFGDLSNRIVKFGAESAKAAIDSKRLAVEKLNTARASLQQIQAEKAFAVATQQSLSAQLSAAQAESRRSSIRRQLAANSAEITTLTKAETAATNQLAAAQSRLSVASRAASGAMNLLKSGFSLIGGPAGAAMLATGAIFYFYQEMQRSRDEAVKLANGLDGLITRMQDMNREQKKSELSNINTALLGLAQVVGKSGEAVREAQEELNNWNQKLSRAKEGSDAYVVAQKGAERAQKSLTAAIQESEKASNDYQKAKSAIRILQADLNGELKQGAELLSHEAKTLLPNGSAALRQYGVDLDNATKSKQKFNSQSLMLDFGGDDGQKLKQRLERDLALSKLEGEAKVRLQVKFAADDSGVVDPMAIQKLQDDAVATYQNNEQKREKSKLDKQGAKTANEAADALKSQYEAVARLNTGYKDNSLEMAKYDAVVRLGNKATQEQINKAKELAEAQWKAEEAVRNLAQAEQGRKYANQEIAAAKVAENPYTDTAEDPLAQINLQEQQKLEALEKYRLIDTENAQLYEDAKTAIMQQATYDRERILKQEQDEYKNNMAGLLGSTSEFASSLAGAFGDAVGESNAAYKALFAVSKAFAIAQASLNLQTAIGNALAMPWPANIPAIAQAMAAGSQLVNAVRGVNYGGRRYGGNVSGGNPYRINESGESEIFQTYDGKQAFIPNKSGKVIPADKASNGAANISVTIIHTGQPFSVEDQRVKQGNDGQMMLELITRSIDEGSTVSQAIERNFNTNRRARGGY
ncbi:tape measure protein [Providencia alcalifaciens]|uniref:tape measure protein n=1 Tax=Providencia alcalifaciens TaxID=126385 RepID=UPI0012B61AEF|nr:tape measure protein [Providencia alcalifaciens]MTC54913.1 tape measure protein [Providencia alcalifaciens]